MPEPEQAFAHRLVNLIPLRNAWDRLLRPFGVDRDASDRVFRDLAAAYSAPGRYYHTLTHIQHVLETIESLNREADDLAALELAAWFHDAVYDPRAKDNEERSADYAEQVLRGFGLPEGTIAVTRQLIMQTRTHQPVGGDRDSRVFLDADLAILGAPADRYEEYARAIRQEYAWVPEEQYRSGRRQVLRNFLERPRLYQTAPMFEAFEEQARRNLTGEVERLSGRDG
jgi:predicted metal-dependent HD superfamily phosphohydrolase